MIIWILIMRLNHIINLYIYNIMENKFDLDYMTSNYKKHIFKIKDTTTGKIMTSVGECTYFSTLCDELGEGWYEFKTANNESNVKKIIYKKGKFIIDNMMRNKPVPNSYEVISHVAEDKYTEEELKKKEFQCKIHNILKNRCGYYSEYLHYKTPVTLNLKSINKTVNVEYFTPDWFGCNDIINYRTDHITMSSLSLDDLNLVFNKCL